MGNEQKVLGCISLARFGLGGYQDAQIGLSLQFDMKGTGVGTFIGGWAYTKPPSHAQWTKEDQRRTWADAVEKLNETLHAAKKQDVSQLVGVPVEVTLDGNVLKSWRVLTEVIG